MCVSPGWIHWIYINRNGRKDIKIMGHSSLRTLRFLGNFCFLNTCVILPRVLIFLSFTEFIVKQNKVTIYQFLWQLLSNFVFYNWKGRCYVPDGRELLKSKKHISIAKLCDLCGVKILKKIWTNTKAIN